MAFWPGYGAACFKGAGPPLTILFDHLQEDGAFEGCLPSIMFIVQAPNVYLSEAVFNSVTHYMRLGDAVVASLAGREHELGELKWAARELQVPFTSIFDQLYSASKQLFQESSCHETYCSIWQLVFLAVMAKFLALWQGRFFSVETLAVKLVEQCRLEGLPLPVCVTC